MASTSDLYAADGETNSPDVSASNLDKPKVRAISSDEQLANLIKGLESDNRDRNVRNARIMSKYNAEKPYKDSELEAANLSWRSNFSTQPLATLIDRIAPRFARAEESARYLTAAKLPDHVEGATLKTERFRSGFTKLVREHPDWRNLVSEISMEDSLFGYTVAAWTDEFEWFPRHFRQDEFYVPAGTKQNAAHCPLLILRETLLPNELAELVDDEDESSETAGWVRENVAECINNARSDDTRAKDTSTDGRRIEDSIRETNLYSSLAKGARVCQLYHAFLTEVSGKVSHYILDGHSWKRLFGREDQFDSMSEVASFFSFQQANGRLQGSKGVGRTVYALAGIIDRSRNEVIDRFQLSGKIILQAEAKDIPRFSMSVIGGAVLISKAFAIQQTRIESGVEQFVALDNWIARMMDELAGNVSPAQVADQIQGERPTNGQINLIADLNNEGKDVKIARFMTHLSQMLSQMQFRASHSRVQEKRAKNFRAYCLEVMSEDELKALSEQASASTIADYTDIERQQVIIACDSVRGNPLVNQKKALEAKLTAAVDSDFAQSLLLPENDPTEEAEQTRLQMLENALLSGGKQVAVSPRDSHLIHLPVLLSEMEQVAAAVGTDPQNAQLLKNMLDHGDLHIQQASQLGITPDQLAPFQQSLDRVRVGLTQFAEMAATVATGGPQA